MIVLSGASASGKTEAAKMLMVKYGIQKAITTTTRSMRVHEVNGKDYWFFLTTRLVECPINIVIRKKIYESIALMKGRI